MRTGIVVHPKPDLPLPKPLPTALFLSNPSSPKSSLTLDKSVVPEEGLEPPRA